MQYMKAYGSVDFNIECMLYMVSEINGDNSIFHFMNITQDMVFEDILAKACTTHLGKNFNNIYLRQYLYFDQITSFIHTTMADESIQQFQLEHQGFSILASIISTQALATNNQSHNCDMNALVRNEHAHIQIYEACVLNLITENGVEPALESAPVIAFDNPKLIAVRSVTMPEKGTDVKLKVSGHSDGLAEPYGPKVLAPLYVHLVDLALLKVTSLTAVADVPLSVGQVLRRQNVFITQTKRKYMARGARTTRERTTVVEHLRKQRVVCWSDHFTGMCVGIQKTGFTVRICLQTTKKHKYSVGRRVMSFQMWCKFESDFCHF
uniref:Uncharacterized protein n=1 Tax=Glossina pallidipes TaxID=7398 RepID=A0A1A9ZT73_GLOPL